MSLNPPRQPSGSPAHLFRPDPEALLLEAVRQRRRHESLQRLQRCVHRRGPDWLHQFQSRTLPALEGNEAVAWLGALLGEESGHAAEGGGVPLGSPPLESVTSDSLALVMAADPQGVGEDSSWIEQRATAAVDGAIASMLAECPELVPPVHRLGAALPLPLTVVPPAPPVPQVLPGRVPPPVFSFAGPPSFEPMVAAGSQQGLLPGDAMEESGKKGLSHLESSGAAADIDDVAPFEGPSDDFAAPKQWTAAELGAALGSRLLRRISRSDWRTLARIRRNPTPDPQVTEPAVAGRLQPAVPEEFHGPVASHHLPALAPQDPLAVVVRFAESQTGEDSLEDAAPSLPALADLRAWLPNSSMPRAS